MTTEIWKPIPSIPGYFASNLGRVKNWLHIKHQFEKKGRKVIKTGMRRLHYVDELMKEAGV